MAASKSDERVQIRSEADLKKLLSKRREGSEKDSENNVIRIDDESLLFSAIRMLLDVGFGLETILVEERDAREATSNLAEFSIQYCLFEARRDSFSTFVIQRTWRTTDAPCQSLVSLIPVAGLYEKEVEELFGISFSYPSECSPRAFLLTENFDGFPMRKQYSFPETVFGIEHRRTEKVKNVVAAEKGADT